MGSKRPEMVRITYKLVKSPSHAVGLERNNRVAITLSPGDKVMVFQLSPSHAMGLELGLERGGDRGGLKTLKSHHPTRWA